MTWKRLHMASREWEKMISMCFMKGIRDAGGNISILSPGTGLGEAGLFWDGQSHHPFATEGGHCDFSCRNAPDLQLHDYMLKKFKVVSWESIIAGPGNSLHFYISV